MAKTEWLKKTLPQGFKKEFLGPEQQSHRISRGRDFLKVEFLRYCTCSRVICYLLLPGTPGMYCSTTISIKLDRIMRTPLIR